MEKKLTVEGADAGKRLDKYLVEKLGDTSRSQIQKWIINGSVTVDMQKVTKHHFLEESDAIVLSIVAEDTSMKGQPVEIPIIYEDDAILVVNKPTGVLVHPVFGKNQWTLVHFLQDHVEGIDEVGEKDRPGIVHRLDRDASGVMVIAKTQEAFKSLKEQFMKRTVAKNYRAVVHGVPVNKSDVIKFVIAHSKTKGGKMAARPEHEEGKDAWTEYDTIRTFNKRYAELSVRIRTGRTHQIRAHLAAINHPIVGDVLYKAKQYKGKHEYARLFLHAYTLGITHPISGEKVQFEAELPAEIDNFFDTE